MSPVQERLCDVLSRTDVPPGYVYSYCNSNVRQSVSRVVFPIIFEVRRSVLECLSSATNRLSIPGSNDAYWDATVHKYAKDVIQGRYHAY